MLGLGSHVALFHIVKVLSLITQFEKSVVRSKLESGGG